MVSKILIVEDDTGLQKYLKELLLDNGCSTQTASDGIAALNQLAKVLPDLVILDLGLPNMSGESVMAEIRKKYPDLPIIILTAKDSVSDIVQGLNMGADDYMTKPFIGSELLARIKARLRRDGASDSKLRVGDLELDDKTFEVKRGKKNIQLTPQEFKLLEYLMRNRGRVWLYSERMISPHITGAESS